MMINNLIYDVGMHVGNDTAYYLKKGFHVVAIEANPDLVSQAKSTFAREINEGRLILVEGAVIAPEQIAAGQDKVAFYINEQVSEWGTADQEVASKNVHLGTHVREIAVSAIDFADVLTRYGVPYYMKIDIEGSDRICLEALKKFEARPAFVSYEASKESMGALTEELNLLNELGFTSYMAIEQSLVMYQKPPDPAREGESVEHVFPFGSSGLFGRDLPQRSWCDRRWLLRRFRIIMLGYRLLGDYGALMGMTFPGARFVRGGVRRILQYLVKAPVPGWYDIHAARGI